MPAPAKIGKRERKFAVRMLTRAASRAMRSGNPMSHKDHLWLLMVSASRKGRK